MVRDETILLTGGAGFIGSRVAARLVDDNRLRILDTFDRDALRGRGIGDHPNLELITGDVRDAELVARAVDGVDRVVHLASLAGVSTVLERPTDTLRVALEGTTNILDAAVKSGGVKRVVVFSTSEVYGRFADNVSELDPTPIGPVHESRWTYAVAKIAAEHLAHAFGRQFGLPVVTLRPFNVYGPGQIGEGAIHNFLSRAVRDQPLTVNNDGSQIRAWCYVDDMVEATLLALSNPDAAGHAFNVGNPDTAVTVLELAETILRLAGSDAGIERRVRDYPDVEHRVPDVSRAEQILGFRPSISLEDGIGRTLAWYRAHV